MFNATTVFLTLAVFALAACDTPTVVNQQPTAAGVCPVPERVLRFISGKTIDEVLDVWPADMKGGASYVPFLALSEGNQTPQQAADVAACGVI
jgi:hypothetical protein